MSAGSDSIVILSATCGVISKSHVWVVIHATHVSSILLHQVIIQEVNGSKLLSVNCISIGSAFIIVGVGTMYFGVFTNIWLYVQSIFGVYESIA